VLTLPVNMQFMLGMTAQDLIDSLGGPTAVGNAIGIRMATVSAWSQRGRIPVIYWDGLIKFAKTREHALDYAALVALHTAPRDEENQ